MLVALQGLVVAVFAACQPHSVATNEHMCLNPKVRICFNHRICSIICGKDLALFRRVGTVGGEAPGVLVEGRLPIIV